MAAGSHSPISARTIENSVFWPWLTNTSTYSTQPTTIAAFPDQAVIQYSQALEKPARLPNAARAYAYGPPSAGSRLLRAANMSASARAPTVVSAIANRLIGPYDAREARR